MPKEEIATYRRVNKREGSVSNAANAQSQIEGYSQQ